MKIDLEEYKFPPGFYIVQDTSIRIPDYLWLSDRLDSSNIPHKDACFGLQGGLQKANYMYSFKSDSGLVQVNFCTRCLYTWLPRKKVKQIVIQGKILES